MKHYSFKSTFWKIKRLDPEEVRKFKTFLFKMKKHPFPEMRMGHEKHWKTFIDMWIDCKSNQEVADEVGSTAQTIVNWKKSLFNIFIDNKLNKNEFNDCEFFKDKKGPMVTQSVSRLTKKWKIILDQDEIESVRNVEGINKRIKYILQMKREEVTDLDVEKFKSFLKSQINNPLKFNVDESFWNIMITETLRGKSLKEIANVLETTKQNMSLWRIKIIDMFFTVKTLIKVNN